MKDTDRKQLLAENTVNLFDKMFGVKLIKENIYQSTSWEVQLPPGIKEYALKKFEYELSQLNYPHLIVLPLTPEGEEERSNLMNNQGIQDYGMDEYNFKYEGDTYLAILVNND